MDAAAARVPVMNRSGIAAGAASNLTFGPQPARPKPSADDDAE